MSARRQQVATPADAYEHAAELADQWAGALGWLRTPQSETAAQTARDLAKEIRRVARIAARGGR